MAGLRAFARVRWARPTPGQFGSAATSDAELVVVPLDRPWRTG